MSLAKGMGKMVTSNRWIHSAATGVAVFTLTFLSSFISGSIFLSPGSSNAETKKSNISVTVDSTLAISTDATNGILSIPLNPTSAGSEATGTLSIDVSTNNLTGYTLSIGSSTNTTDLVHTLEPTNAIPSTTTLPAAPSALAINQWGYSNWTDTQITNSTAPTTYYRIPGTTSDTLRTTTGPLAHSSTKLSFGARADTTIPAGTYAHTLNLTATSNYVPDPPACPVIAGKTYLQEVENPTATKYGRAGQRVVLKDRRNNQDYYVQNILNNDGTCTAWMETNLRYAGDGTYDPSWGYPDDRYATTATNDTANTNDDARPLGLHSGTGYIGGSQANSYTTAGYIDLYAKGQSTDILDTTNPQNNTLFYGYLYNWCAAMGGQANACNNTSITGFDTTISICPAGWRLPTGNTDGDFDKLNQAVNGAAISPVDFIFAFLAVYSGYYTDALYDQGIYGRYWSSTIASATLAYNLHFIPITINAYNDYDNKGNGQSIRCVKDTRPPRTLEDATSMQNVTSKMCENTPLGTTVSLMDERDNKYYRVRKMADNRCWMIDNLAYSLLQNDTGTTPNTGAPTFSPAAQVDTTPSGTPNLTSVDTQAQYAMNTSAYNIPNNGNTTPSYLYNWCAAMGDTSTNCATTVDYRTGQPATPQTGICPAGWRLPMGGAEPTTPGDGSNQATAAATTTNEFAKLDIWMGGTGTYRANANTYANFTTDNATSPQLFWLGALGGLYVNGLISQGSYGYWWSSTAISYDNGYSLSVDSGKTLVYPANGLNRYRLHGFAVRCIL